MFDVKRLTEVQRRMLVLPKMNSRNAKSKNAITNHEHNPTSSSSSLPQHVTMQQQDQAVLIQAAFFLKGDYELYKKELEEQTSSPLCPPPSVQRSDSWTSASSSASASASASSYDDNEAEDDSKSKNSISVVREKVHAKERLIQEYRQRIADQEKKTDKMYSQLNKTALPFLETLQRSHEELSERYLQTLDEQQERHQHHQVENNPSTLDILLKASMLFGLLVHCLGGSTDCLAVAVFGWWLSESFLSC